MIYLPSLSKLLPHPKQVTDLTLDEDDYDYDNDNDDITMLSWLSCTLRTRYHGSLTPFSLVDRF
jgi:hypothetical protein